MSETNQNAAPSAERGDRQTRVGVVVSDAMDKTVVVQVDRRVQHPKYLKFVSRRSKFMAHDENGTCSVGDRVEIRETRPLSARKRWRVVRILDKAR